MDNLDIIKTLCAKAGISVKTLEKELGFSNGSLAKSATIKADRLQKIADYFNVSVDYILTGEQKEINSQPKTPGISIVDKTGESLTFDINSIIYSIMEAVTKMPPEQQEMVNNMVGGKKKKIIFVENPHNKLNTAHVHAETPVTEAAQISNKRNR